jgi:hypothetical protein
LDILAHNLYISLIILKYGDCMAVLDEETLKMRYRALVKKGILDEDECASYSKKIDIKPCMKQKVDKFQDFFVPGTVLISEKASYRLRVGYSME